MSAVKAKLVPVILSGGSGSRLWPVSRKLHPKPFMRLPDGDTLMGKTYLRAVDLEGVSDVLTVTNRDLYFRTRDEFDQLERSDIKQHYLLEPVGRNTAPAMALAALQLAEQYGSDVCLLVMPADHLVTEQSAFKEAVDNAVALAEKGNLVTFGIQPTHPETGFGYIKAAKNEASESGGYPVSCFVEKPDLVTAESYVESGDYYWNAGIFCLTAGSLLREMAEHEPELLTQVKETLAASSAMSSSGVEQLELDRELFSQVADISIDYAIMEKSDKVSVVPCDPGWSDIGSWNAYSEMLPADESGNRLVGDVIALDTQNTTVHSPNILTATVGVQDLVVVHTSDAMLIAHKDSAQKVKDVVNQLDKTGHHAHLVHRTVHRPWGSYTTLEEGERFKIKRIVVKPGQSLSLQLHHHRSEHWIVVSGMARVVNDTKEFLLNSNESTFIPAGHQHRLENPGVIDLVLIEVQSGDYLGEDDIIRFDDLYGR